MNSTQSITQSEIQSTTQPTQPATQPIYERIYLVVRQIPAGKVANYGQIASIVGGCTARMVGYAMASAPDDSEVPWQRVINSQGKISPRGNDRSSEIQRLRLSEEGVYFNQNGKVDWKKVRWSGPELEWLLEHGFDPHPSFREIF